MAHTHTHWVSGEPNNNADEDSGELEDNGYWNDEDCKHKIWYKGRRAKSQDIHSSWDHGLRQHRSWYSSAFSNFNNHHGGDRLVLDVSVSDCNTEFVFRFFFFFSLSLSLSL